MKKSVVVLASWVWVTFVLLIIYGQEEINNDVYVDVDTNRDGTKSSEYQGKLIVGSLSAHLIFLFGCLFIVGAKLTSGPAAVLFLIFIAVFMTEEIAIIQNCANGHPKCFEYRTPLYILILINSAIHSSFPFVMLGLSCCGFCRRTDQPVNQPPVNNPVEQPANQPVEQPVIPPEIKLEMIEVTTPKVTYETILKIRNLNGNDKCTFCSDDLKTTDDMQILGCGHYFHKTCSKEWEKRSRQCPICMSNVI